MQKFIVEITEENETLIQDPALECYLITSSLERGFAAGFARRAAAAGKLVLAGGGDAPALCRDLCLDGFVLDVSASEKIKADFDRAVKTAGKDKVSGLIVRGRRHEAMLAGECEPDFIIFQAWRDGLEKIRELVQWYSELFLIQSAVFCREEGVDFRSLAADIVILNDRFYKILVAKKQSLD